MAMEIGADLKDITAVQVHPTGLVHPDEPDAKLKVRVDCLLIVFASFIPTFV